MMRNSTDIAASQGSPPGGQSTPAFECVDVSVRLGAGTNSRVVIDGLTFSVKRGEFVTLVGASGIGKTTILRTLGGLQATEPPSRISLHGEPVTGPSRGVVLVFQDYLSSLLPWRTVEKNVRLGIEGKVPKGEYSERVGTALRSVGLADRAGDYPAHLSGGMQQRVQLARALAMEPAVLLMDEPFGALDAMTKAQLQDELQKLHDQMQMTIVFVTHDIEEAIYLSDRVLVLGGPPAHVTESLTIDLPRPREQLVTKEMPGYLKYRHHLYEAIAKRHQH
jgi:NitT/TauT family transport system ATP-binding protein